MLIISLSLSLSLSEYGLCISNSNVDNDLNLMHKLVKAWLTTYLGVTLNFFKSVYNSLDALKFGMINSINVSIHSLRNIDICVVAR